MQCVGDWGSALLVLPADQDPVKWGLSTCTKLSWMLHKVLLTNTTVYTRCFYVPIEEARLRCLDLSALLWLSSWVR